MMRKVVMFLMNIVSPDFKIDSELTSYECFEFLSINLIKAIRGAVYQMIHFKKAPLLMLGKGTRFFYQNRVFFGKKNRIGSHVILSGLGKSGLTLGNNVSIGDFSRIEVSQTLGDIGEGIVIGDNVGISSFAGIGGAGGLSIGNDCIIGQYFSCHPENHGFVINDKIFRHQEVSRHGIQVGQNCWIGAKVTLLDGTVIGNNCVIAAGAVVRGSYPDNVLIGGVPSRVLRALS